MSLQQAHHDLTFSSVKLYKDQTFGIGSYGSVCMAKCDDLICAAKILHPTLVLPAAEQPVTAKITRKLPSVRFLQECEVMSAIKHPNIVQYLGTFQDPESQLPVLLMELMDTNLTQFLHNSLQPLPYHIQLNISHDITRALSFLHSNNIFHRDLSSNNVLLIGDMRAKVTDFGMAKLDDINPNMPNRSLTMCPGTQVYMPPEAVHDKPLYTAKIDSFSFGVLVVQILTHEFPKPSDRLRTVRTIDPQFPTLQTPVSEIDRRQSHISLVDPTHPLLPVALECLKDESAERPTAHDLSERISVLKESPQYNESKTDSQEPKTLEDSLPTIPKKHFHAKETVTNQAQGMKEQHSRQISGLEQVLRSRNNQLFEKIQVIVAKQQENNLLRQQLAEEQEKFGEEMREKERLVQERERQLLQQVESSKEIITHLKRRICKLEAECQHLSHNDESTPQSRARTLPMVFPKHKPITAIRWREGKIAPCQMHRETNAVVSDDKVYLIHREKDKQKIYSFSPHNSIWTQLPNSPTDNCTLAVINNLLTTIGGEQNGHKTNHLFSLTGEGDHRKWTRVFPSMPTKRSGVVAVSSETALIVAGGEIEDETPTKRVEIMNTNADSRQWFTAADLPCSLGLTSMTICHDHVYLLGECYDDAATRNGHTRAVYSCPLSVLLQAEHVPLVARRLVRIALPKSWNRIADLPVTRCTCVTLQDNLLSIGGLDSDRKSTTAVYVYNRSTNTWKLVGHMTTARQYCFAAVLPNKELLIAGGYTKYYSGETDNVEIGCVH